MVMSHKQATHAGQKGGTNGWKRLSPKQQREKMQRMRDAKAPPASPEQRLLDKVHKTRNGCWVFIGCLNEDGYGIIGYGKRARTVPAHRLAWMVWRGLIPKGLYVLHKCDTPACVNPKHLFLGTQTDNMRDMARKGRSACVAGESNPRAVLTCEDVQAIRREPRMHGLFTRLAAQYGVSASAIQRAWAGKSWA